MIIKLVVPLSHELWLSINDLLLQVGVLLCDQRDALESGGLLLRVCVMYLLKDLANQRGHFKSKIPVLLKCVYLLAKIHCTPEIN